MGDDHRFAFAETEVELKRGWSVFPSGLCFTFFHPSEVRSMSVVVIDKPGFVSPLGEPIPGGLHDRRMGPMSDTSAGGGYLEDACLTCGLNFYYCPGHFGRLELPFPVINPVCYETVQKLLRVCCFQCHRFRLKDEARANMLLDFRGLEEGLVGEQSSAPEEHSNSGRKTKLTSSMLEGRKAKQMEYVELAAKNKCTGCGDKCPRIQVLAGRFMIGDIDGNDGSEKKP
jgi:DNA-directed RNA polymerase beta' subunit